MKAVPTPPGRHPKRCQCERCVEVRFGEYQDRIDDYAKKGVIPHSPEQTIMVREYTVRPHFRKNKNHLNGDEKLRDRIGSYLKQLLKKRYSKAA